MRNIDINCDLGELDDGSDLLIMPFISSCNIACGEHAGNAQLMSKAVLEAINHQVVIGAHPGYPDRKNFGRVSVDLAGSEVEELIYNQVVRLQEIALKSNSTVSYIKLHGALYHDALTNKAIAQAVISGASRTGLELRFLGPTNSELEIEAKAAGLPYHYEAFIDRRYDDKGKLVPRSKPNAVIGDVRGVEGQLLEIVLRESVTSISGNKIDLNADSICIHGDHPGAIENARMIRKILTREGVSVKSFIG
ncbi:MAG: LamB/YcsF family protein [Cyclobacteriaceae bacterium]|nr:LamB/YcsF family protein [Cyclobacteriaceae bacterium SS2]